jgi:hypothetical protein
LQISAWARATIKSSRIQRPTTAGEKEKAVWPVESGAAAPTGDELDKRELRMLTQPPRRRIVVDIVSPALDEGPQVRKSEHYLNFRTTLESHYVQYPVILILYFLYFVAIIIQSNLQV